MSLFNQRQTIEELIAVGFPLREPEIKYTWQNVDRLQPDDEVVVQFGIRWGTVDRMGIGCRRYRYINTFFANAYAPLKRGTKQIESACFNVMSLLDEAEFDNFFFNSFLLTDLRQEDDRYTLTMSALFETYDLLN